MEIVLKKTSELIPYINNTRTHDEKQIKQIAASIKEFGLLQEVEKFDEKSKGNAQNIANNKLKRLNRNLSKKKKGSNNRKLAKKQLAKLHIKIANQRKDYFHKLTNDLANNYDTIFIEDLNMKAMQRVWGRKISDLAFSEFVNILNYKTNVVKIDRFYPSSKTCSCCGTVNEDMKNLKNRIFKCNSCNLEIDRDLNASVNIHRVGASTLRGETVRLTSVS